jgi:hypothetical protein
MASRDVQQRRDLGRLAGADKRGNCAQGGLKKNKRAYFVIRDAAYLTREGRACHDHIFYVRQIFI